MSGERFLVSVADLATELASSTPPIVLDGSVLRVREPKPHYVSGAAAFDDRHIPSAHHADLMAVFSDATSPLPFTAPGAAGFAAAAASVGARRERHVVVYDVYDGTWAARLWWLFRAYGFDVRILDGGLRAWEAAGHPVERGGTEAGERASVEQVLPEKQVLPEEVAALEAAFAGHPSAVFVDADAVADAIATGDALVVCGLRPAVYSGEEVSAARAGHIPTSINIPYASLVDPETKTHLDPTSLLERIGGADRRVITYCGGGVNAAGVAFALLRAGARSVSVYDGSMSEWARDPRRPLVVGSAPGDAPPSSSAPSSSAPSTSARPALPRNER